MIISKVHSNLQKLLAAKYGEMQQSFLNEFETCSASKFLQIMREGAVITHEGPEPMIKADNVLSLMVRDDYRFPVFQIDEYGRVFPGIVDALSKIHGTSRDNWDLALWLVTPLSVVVCSESRSPKTLDLAFDDMLNASLTQIVYEGRPIDALLDRKKMEFSACLEAWLKGTERTPNFTSD